MCSDPPKSRMQISIATSFLLFDRDGKADMAHTQRTIYAVIVARSQSSPMMDSLWLAAI